MMDFPPYFFILLCQIVLFFCIIQRQVFLNLCSSSLIIFVMLIFHAGPPGRPFSIVFVTCNTVWIIFDMPCDLHPALPHWLPHSCHYFITCYSQIPVLIKFYAILLPTNTPPRAFSRKNTTILSCFSYTCTCYIRPEYTT